MRAIFIAMLMAMGIGLIGAPASSAAPVSGSSLLNAVEDISPVEQVQRRGGGRGGFRGGGGGGFRGGRGGGGFRGGRRGGGRYFRGGRWWFYGGCSLYYWELGLCG